MNLNPYSYHDNHSVRYFLPVHLSLPSRMIQWFEVPAMPPHQNFNRVLKRGFRETCRPCIAVC